MFRGSRSVVGAAVARAVYSLGRYASAAGAAGKWAAGNLSRDVGSMGYCHRLKRQQARLKRQQAREQGRCPFSCGVPEYVRLASRLAMVNTLAKECAIRHLIVPLTVERTSEILHFSLYECCATFCN